MANELSINQSLTFAKGNYRLSITPGNLQFTVTGTLFEHNTVTVTTSDGALNKGSIGTIGYCYVRNLDATNYVDVGVDGTNYVVRLKPGENALFPVHGSAVHAKANTASCNVEYAFVEE